MALVKKITGVLLKSVLGFIAITFLIVVISSVPAAVQINQTPQSGALASKPVFPDEDTMGPKRNGNWVIQPDSAVYTTVRTPRTSVNMKFSEITGDCRLIDIQQGKMDGRVQVAVSSVDSGVTLRDNWIKQPEYLYAEKYPTASFQLKSAGRWPALWRDGDSQKFSISGDLTLKGVTKPVNFECEGMFEGEVFKVKGTHTLNMSDYGIETPHSLLFRTEKEATITIQLILVQKGGASI